jgi:hypothetical protein
MNISAKKKLLSRKNRIVGSAGLCLIFSCHKQPETYIHSINYNKQGPKNDLPNKLESDYYIYNMLFSFYLHITYDWRRGAGISIIAGADIHIFVFTDCKNNQSISKEINWAEHEYMNICPPPPIIDIPAPLDWRVGYILFICERMLDCHLHFCIEISYPDTYRLTSGKTIIQSANRVF